jgi:hypothetical protein
MTKKYIFPAGTYYIGDPCYVIRNEWAWLGVCNQLEGKDGGIFMWHNEDKWIQGWANSTAWGDGMYRGSDKQDYAVDSGLIGVMPVPEDFDIKRYFPYTEVAAGVKIFAKDFIVTYENGVFYIGNIRINTN